jgi:transposase
VLGEPAAAAGGSAQPWVGPGHGIELSEPGRAAGLAWPLPEDLDDGRLEALLFPPPSGTPADQRPMPDWAWVHRELRRPDVRLALLWEEYRAGAPDGFGYS